MPGPIAATDNLTLLAVMQSGDPGTKPSPAARAFYHETVDAIFQNPVKRNSFFNNAWNLFTPWLSSPRAWEGYTDKVAVRRTAFGATSIVVDAHGIPTTVQANPNDAQNELRFKKYRPEYRQGTILLTRDQYVPITVDPIQIGRLLAEGHQSNSASAFMAAQITQMLNLDKAQEFNTLWNSLARYLTQPGIFYVHTAALDPATITPAQATAAAVAIRAAVMNLADFTNAFSPARNIQTVPAAQVELIISTSAMQALGLGYASAFNTEYVLALPADQIVVVPDRYFQERPEFQGLQVDWLIVDKGNDQADGGTFVVVDSLYEQGVDPFNITGTSNQALHHAEFLDLNPFKTLIVGGAGEGTQIVNLSTAPTAITFDVYTDQGIIAPGGNLPRGVEFSTQVFPVDALGSPAGGYKVEITGATSPTDSTGILRYSDGKIGNDEFSTSITVTVTSTVDPSITASHTYTLTGPIIDLANGATYIEPITFPGVFAAGSGSGGTYTYTPATGVVYEKTLDGGTTWAALGSSPVAVAHLATITVRATAASGYVFQDGTTVKLDGPHTAA